MDDDDTAVLKFQNELLGVFLRWLEESDLDDMQLLEAAVAMMNKFGDDVVTFEPDPQAFFGEEEEE
jgi:hypothetical protein